MQGGIYSQIGSVIEFIDPSLFKGKGVIFVENLSPPIQLPKNAKIINLTKEQVYISELIFLNQFSQNATLAFFNNKNIKKYFWYYNRQYLGFKDENGRINVIINLLNFRNKKIAEKKFEGWGEEYFIGFGEYYEKNTLRISVNIDLCKVDVW